MKKTYTVPKNIITKKRAKTLKIAIVKTDYHEEMVNSMSSAAEDILTDAGVLKKNITTITAPGSWEIPVLVETALSKKKYDAVIALGILVKGETYHFDMIANEVARALMNISLTYTTPIAMEVLGVYKKKDAKKRTTGKHNKGIEAAVAVLKTIAARDMI